MTVGLYKIMYSQTSEAKNGPIKSCIEIYKKHIHINIYIHMYILLND